MLTHVKHVDFDFAKAAFAEGNQMISPDLFFIKNRKSTPSISRIGVPFFTVNACCLCILNGHASYKVNLENFDLRNRDVLLIPKDAILEIGSLFEDLEIRLCSLGERNTYDFPALVHIPDDAIWERVLLLLRLFESYLQEIDYESAVAVQNLIVIAVSKAMREAPERSGSDRHDHLQAFIGLIHRYGMKKRDVSFYAKEMSLTPNWLSHVVKSRSGQTVLEWIMDALIQHAKLYLVFTDFPVSRIALELGFTSGVDFSRVFKRKTRMTPQQFRGSVQALPG
ncbi:MAG: helix-turn-helix transcriptional regulator [Candidatus Cryptobacteroides sp.]|jgi:AraC-like DNA-binding protein